VASTPTCRGSCRASRTRSSPTYERFTDRARRVVVLAQEHARLRNHHHIGTEHLLLGLVAEGEGVAFKVLTGRLELTADQISAGVTAVALDGLASPSGHIPVDPRFKKVCELALREALQLGHNYIGTEHLLLGLVREGEGIAAQVLISLAGDLSKVRRSVIDELMSYDTPARTISIRADVVHAFINWVDAFDEANGPLAKTHPAVLVAERLRNPIA
jgi:ATP-dependent Clp protease ATP-binding subunit ClpA